jgi:hypothetical protein
MALADAVRVVASAAASMRAEADKENAESASETIPSDHESNLLHPSSPAPYLRVLETAEHRDRAAKAAAAENAARAHKESRRSAAVAAAKAAMSQDEAAQYRAFSMREASAKAAAALAAAAAASARSTANSTAAAHTSVSKLSDSVDFVHHLPSVVATERLSSEAAEKAAAAAAAAAAASQGAVADLDKAHDMTANQLKVSIVIFCSRL